MPVVFVDLKCLGQDAGILVSIAFKQLVHHFLELFFVGTIIVGLNEEGN